MYTVLTFLIYYLIENSSKPKYNLDDFKNLQNKV